MVSRGTLVCRCLLVSADGRRWTLIDSGLGTKDCTNAEARLGRRFLRMTRSVLNPQETAWVRVRDPGIDPRSVEDIILTRRDVDHAGGISDFPWARVHLSVQQHELLGSDDRGLARRLHALQWSHGPHWAPVELRGTYHGVARGDISEHIALLSLPGMDGHCGVLIRRPEQVPLLHAGDAVFSSRTLGGISAPWGLALFERMTRTDTDAWKASRRWLQQEYQGGRRSSVPTIPSTMHAGPPYENLNRVSRETTE